MRRAIPIVLVLAAAVVLVVLLASGGKDDSYQVRAIFMNAFSAIKGEDVKIAGVKVGKIETIDVTPDHRAAVVLRIDRKEFADFRRDAECTIRPQSLIGEKYVECTPTQPRTDGAPAPPPLPRIERGPGEGQHLLPVSQTSQPVDLDLLNNIMRLPYRQRFAIIINELGTGLAGRGDDLRQAIRNADPALKETDKVIKILASQNQTLRRLAVDGDRILAPLARDRARVADWIDQSGTTATATAEKSAALEENIKLLPAFLRRLRPTMEKLGALSDEMTPTLVDLGAAAPDLNRLILQLGPFSQASIPAFQSLGKATDVGRPALLASKPIIDQLNDFTKPGTPLARNLAALTTSLQKTGGTERLLDYLFYQVAAINGFDTFGHYLRAGLILNACTDYVDETRPDCTANFTGPGSVGESQQASGNARAASVSSSTTQPGPLGRLVLEAQQLYAQGKDPALAAKAIADRQDAAAKRSAAPRRGAKRARATTRRTRATSPGRPLAMPSILPAGDPPQGAAQPSGGGSAPSSGQEPQSQQQPAQGSGSGSPSPAQTSLLDYLLGDGS